MIRLNTQENYENGEQDAKRMIAVGKYVLEEIVNISGLSLAEVKELQAHENI